jgi:hypothetical protein
MGEASPTGLDPSSRSFKTQSTPLILRDLAMDINLVAILIVTHLVPVAGFWPRCPRWHISSPHLHIGRMTSLRGRRHIERQPARNRKRTCSDQRVTGPLKPHQEPRSSRGRYCTSRTPFNLPNPVRPSCSAPDFESVVRRPRIGRAGSILPIITAACIPLGIRFTCGSPMGALPQPGPPSRRRRASCSVHSSLPRFGWRKMRRCAFEEMCLGLAAHTVRGGSGKAGMHLT